MTAFTRSSIARTFKRLCFSDTAFGQGHISRDAEPPNPHVKQIDARRIGHLTLARRLTRLWSACLTSAPACRMRLQE